MITNRDYIKYVDRNCYSINSAKENKRVEELIDRRIPYKEMSESEIEKVIMYHALNMAKLISKQRESEERIKTFNENYNDMKKRNEKLYNKHMDMCNAIIEKEKAQREYYEQEQNKK